MNRPELHNAFDERLIAELTEAFVDLADDAEVRVIVLSGRGRSFSAGADVAWMQRQGTASLEDNTADARKLANLFRAIADSPQTDDRARTRCSNRRRTWLGCGV